MLILLMQPRPLLLCLHGEAMLYRSVGVTVVSGDSPIVGILPLAFCSTLARTSKTFIGLPAAVQFEEMV
jgi:hypothetical protein